MNEKLNEALDATVRNWNAMGKADMDHSESAADHFEHSFYRFIDVFRDWVNSLDQRPESVDELLQSTVCQTIIARLPEPLHLNFETEAELIVDNMVRIEDDKYD